MPVVSQVEVWSCALDFGQIWCGFGLLSLVSILWWPEIGTTGTSIVVSFNKAMVGESPDLAGFVCSGRCGGGWMSGLDDAGASREVLVAASWSLCTAAKDLLL
jgi:hypothetical protein